MIDINHTLVYYSGGDGNGCLFAVNTPKTESGGCEVPMLESVIKAFEMEKENQISRGIGA